MTVRKLMLLCVVSLCVCSCGLFFPPGFEKIYERIGRQPSSDAGISGLVGEWLFDGNANDTSTYANHGSYSNVAFMDDRFGKMASAAYFNGISSFIRIKDAPQYNSASITIAFWLKPDYQSASEMIPLSKIYQTQNYSYGWNFSYGVSGYPSVSQFYGQMTNQVIATCYPGLQIPTNTTFVVFSFDSANGMCHFYLDGAMVYSVPAQFLFGEDNPFDISVGASLDQTGQFPAAMFQGIVDDLRIFNRTLNNDEIMKLYTMDGWLPAPKSPPQITSLWPDLTADINGPSAVVLSAGVIPGDAPVTNAYFYIDGILQGSTNSPFTFNSTTISGGVHTLTVIAVDQNGMAATNSTGFQIYDAADTNAGLVFHNSFSGADNYDSSPFNFTVTPVNTVLAIDRNAIAASCAYFNGASSSIELPADAQLRPADAITVAFWFNTDTVSGDQYLVHNGIDGAYNTGYHFMLSGSTLTMWLSDVDEGKPTAFSFTGIMTGTWYHVVLSYQNGVGARFYLNGVIRDSTNTGQTRIEYQNAVNTTFYPVYLGSLNGGSSYLSGYLDNVRIYNRALSPTEISSISSETN